MVFSFICKFIGHKTNPPLVEVWASYEGFKKSLFLCQRCKRPVGEKRYDAQ